MKLNSTAKKTITAILLLLLMSGLYGAVIALCNRYLREHSMLTSSARFIMGAFMIVGYYLIYRWFAKRIDAIGSGD